MRRIVVVAVVLAATVAGLDVLADMTQNRPDRIAPGSRSQIVVEVRHRSTGPAQLRTAQGLWGACQGTVSQQLTERGVVSVGDGRFLMTVSPAVGEHAWRRLQGCLEDMTVDRVKGHVVSKSDFRGEEPVASGQAP
ncbi:MAG: hypothetical protein M3O23_01540 [Actinomycetota bacterium]|nr:hypothetical protein [Actinomycetota bacterium]